MEWILNNKNISPPTLVARFGFESENKAELYLKEPSFLSELKTQIKFSQKRISDELFQKLVSCYDKAILKQKESTSHDTQVLVSLFDVFELIKNLSDEEVTMFHANLPSFVRASYFQGSVKNFRNDLLNMNPLEFEIKYADCFNGFLENTIKSMINAESFYRMIDALEQPSENLSEKVSEPLEKLTESEQEILHRTAETYKPSSKVENYKNEMAKLIKGREKIEQTAQNLSTKTIRNYLMRSLQLNFKQKNLIIQVVNGRCYTQLYLS